MLDPTCLPTDLGCYVSGGTPSSPLNSIQYNNAGSFYGDSLFTRDATTNLTQIGRTSESYVVSDPIFLGVGLDDLQSGTFGGYTGSLPNTYTITIDSTGILGDTFSWSDSYGNSGSGVSITGGAQTLSYNILIALSSNGGHTLNDSWTFTVSATTVTSDFSLTDNGVGLGLNGAALNISDSVLGTSALIGSFDISPLNGSTTAAGILANDGFNNYSSFFVQPGNLHSSITDGADDAVINIIPQYLSLEVEDGSPNQVNTQVNLSTSEIEFVYTDISRDWRTVLDLNGLSFKNGGTNIYTFPTVDGSSGEVLSTDGLGNLSWSTGSSGVSYGNNVTTGHNLELLFIDSSGDLFSAPSLAFITSVLHTPALNINNAYSFPTVDGTSGQILSTNGLGTLSWIPAPGGGTGFTVDGNGNMFAGTDAGGDLTGSAYYNLFIGMNAGSQTTSGIANTAIGYNVLQSNLTGDSNTALGEYALNLNLSGSQNTAIGLNSLVTNSTGSRNTAVGYFSLQQNIDGVNNTANGYNAGQNNTSGNWNLFSGAEAGNLSTTGNGNVFLGQSAGYTNTIGSYNVFAGYQAGYYQQTTDQQIAIGVSALLGSNNVALNTGTGNIAIGPNAGTSNAQGSNNYYFGSSAGSLTSGGGDNIFLGYQAGSTNVMGSYNVILGHYNSTGGVSVNNSIILGYNSSLNNFSNSIVLGYAAQATAANQFVIGSASSPIDEILVVQSGGTECIIDLSGLGCTSDERLKTNIVDLPNDALLKLTNVRTVSYNWLNNPSTVTNIGFLAQNLEPIFPELVATNDRGQKSVYYSQMIPVLVQAIKELDFKLKPFEDLLTTDNTFAGVLRIWLASASNGIESIFSKEIITDKLCVKDTNGQTCLTRSELDSLINNGNNFSVNGSSGGSTQTTTTTTGGSTTGGTDSTENGGDGSGPTTTLTDSGQETGTTDTGIDSTSGTETTGGDTSGTGEDSGSTVDVTAGDTGETSGSTDAGSTDSTGSPQAGGDTEIPQ